MFLAEPDSTQFDLHFRIFGTQVRVHPLFWLVMGLLGWSVTTNPVLPGNGLGDLALWIACAFISILLHELGHVWMGRLFGTDGHIVLYGMGGLAIGSNGLSARWKRILVSFAGPAIQLLFFGVLVGTMVGMSLAGHPLAERTPLMHMMWMLVGINLYWPLLNLLPIWPLDGGMITREVCTGASPSRGLLVSLWISLIVSVIFALQSYLGSQGKGFIPFVGGSTWMAVFFALFAVSSFQAIQVENSRRKSYSDDDLPWER